MALDYGYRAVKATGDDSKAIVTALMGHAPNYSYFVGCSDGGREALQEAQRYPDDFDGIIAGSPVNDQVGEFGSSYLFNSQATLSGPQTNGVPDAYIPTSKLPLLTNAVLAQCAGKDGGLASDAFLNDPRQCKFDALGCPMQCRPGSEYLPDTRASASCAADLRGPARPHYPALPWPRARRRGADRRLDLLDHGFFARIARQPIHARFRFRL